jgi:hypothetical protein
MKKIFLILSAFIFGLAQIHAQTPAQFPAAPGLPQSPFNLGLPGFNNSFGPLFTNQFGNGFASTPLNQLLIQLQFDLTQIYPVVVSINNSFDFNVAVTNAVGSNGTFGNSGIASPATPGTVSTSANASALGQDLSSGTALGGRSPTLGGSSTALGGGVSPALTPNTTTTTGTVAGGSAAVTNGLAFSSTRDVLRALLLLQDDIERMLPLINALNGGNAASLNTLFTNNLGVLTNSSIRTGTNGASISTTGR